MRLKKSERQFLLRQGEEFALYSTCGKNNLEFEAENKHPI
jgi:hypothetical protein